ncbi:hypothetical protein IC216_05995 [Clostridioides sp. ES-S-0145-01]|uniref:glycine rich domain-containing protein n=1 Tax=Clostridioides sp. ES-S-0145-01 TaxID=2770784 RepID=UPI001D112137|nr:hypothetical protein [Clostridioides sp. ES-S-0145-01]
MATVYEFNYTGSEQSVTLKPGKYKLECWGASGGGVGYYNHGKGGYSSGELTLMKKTILYIYTGESGKINGVTSIMFNGGGWASCCGGGATDIRLINGTWDNKQGLLSRIIVAGGGGACYTGNKEFFGGDGGGLLGGNGITEMSGYYPGGTQYEGGRGFQAAASGTFGIGGTRSDSLYVSCGGGGGWFGGAGNTSATCSGGGSGYVLTKDSYKPKGYIPTSEYWLENVVTTTGGSNPLVIGHDGRAKITLLQTLPFLTVSSYNSTTATFKADHTDPTLLTKIEYFIDDILKETITTDLTEEKTINYTLEDNALHTLKIVVTDSTNATAEKVVSISKNIMPLENDANLQDITNKIKEMKDGLKSGKRSIINVLELKDIDASLNNTFVELSEKVKDYFDSADSFFQETNKGKEMIAAAIGNPATKENTFAELANLIGDRKRVSTGISKIVSDMKVFIKIDNSTEPAYYIPIPNLEFKPSFVFAVSEIYGTGGKGNESAFYINCKERKLLIFTESTYSSSGTNGGYSKIFNPDSTVVFEDFETDKKMYLPIGNRGSQSIFYIAIE